MSKALGIEVAVADTAEAAVRAADVVVTTTPAKSPIVKAAWLKPGQHVTAMGADLADKQELEAACLARAGRIVVDRVSQCEVMGELHHALTAGILKDASGVIELGAIANGRAAGRESDAEITICDLTGTGVQDTAIAALAYKRAKAAGAGTVIAN
jgi:ornithine cyclodeaminase